ncbi:MAG: transposase [Flavobacteriales bacterium Tduv]
MEEHLSFKRFFGFRLKYQIPYHTTLCKFFNEIVAKRHMSA